MSFWSAPPHKILLSIILKEKRFFKSGVHWLTFRGALPATPWHIVVLLDLRCGSERFNPRQMGRVRSQLLWSAPLLLPSPCRVASHPEECGVGTTGGGPATACGEASHVKEELQKQDDKGYKLQLATVLAGKMGKL
ncbi:unnamed protein product [Lota lota]